MSAGERGVHGTGCAPCTVHVGVKTASREYRDLTSKSSQLASPGFPTGMLFPNGATPLIGTAADGKLAATKLLLGAGADKQAAHNRGRTPLDIATENGHLAVAKMLRRDTQRLHEMRTDAVQLLWK